MSIFEVIHSWDDRDAEGYFVYAGYKARDARQPLRDAGRLVLRHVKRAFTEEGPGWQDLSEKYQLQKQKKWGFVYPILVASDALNQDGLKSHATRASAISVRSSADGGHLTYTVDKDYAAAHNEGEGKMPQRQFLDLDFDLIERVDEIFLDWLDDTRGANRRRRGDAVNPFQGVTFV